MLPLVLSLALAAAQDPGVPPFYGHADAGSLEVFDANDGAVLFRTMGWDFEKVTEKRLVRSMEGEKPVFKEVAADGYRPSRTVTVYRRVGEAEATYRTVGGEELTYKQAAARFKGGAAALTVFKTRPAEPAVLKVLKPDTVVVTWVNGPRGGT